jgi:hypothetical protein
MAMNEPQARPQPNVKQSVLLLLALLDDVTQRTNLNLPVQVQAIQGISQSVKVLSDIIDRPDQGERIMNLIAKSNPQAMSQVGQMGQSRTPDQTPQTTDNLQQTTPQPRP